MKSTATETYRWHQIGNVTDFGDGNGVRITIDGIAIAVFRLGDDLHAIADECPHAGASLSEGRIVQNGDAIVECPLHAWQFRIEDGECVSDVCEAVETYRCRVEDGQVRIAIPPVETRFLVRYSRAGWIGSCAAADDVEFARGDSVIIETERGEELGTVLATDDASSSTSKTGRVLRRIEPELATEAELTAEFLARAEAALTETAPEITLADSELLHDRKTAVLYFLGEASPALGRLAVQLAAREQFRVLFQPLTDPPPTAGRGGCGQCRTS